jgi:thiol-disulfide isomerase/thioredoxin
MRRLAAVTASLVLLLVLAGCSGGQAPAKPAALGSAPDFELKDLSGATVKFSDTAGSLRLVNFWATWCAPCREEIPYFKEFETKYGPKGFKVVGIAMDDEGLPVVKPFVDELGMNYLVLLGTEEVGERFGGIVGYPTTFLVGRDGTILKKWPGAVPRRVFEKEIESALAGS